MSGTDLAGRATSGLAEGGSRIVVLGEASLVDGFRLAGASVLAAAGPGQVEQAWRSLPEDTALLVMTPMAAGVLGARLVDRPRLTWVVMPR